MSSSPTRLGVPRHLQDYNGYCGPACALMLVDFTGSDQDPRAFAQPTLFSYLRHHADENEDFRSFYSPAESLLATVNDHTAGAWEWTKVYDPDPIPIAERLFDSILEQQQPCLILINEGAHWVVAFGVSKDEEGQPTGLFVRDPAWTGMPAFLGLATFPDEPRINHRKENCPCMAPKGENTPGTVHERYFPIRELLTHRGLQGAPDHEGEGAIALVPPGEPAGAIVFDLTSTATPVPNPATHAGAAALAAVQKCGLTGSPDSPPEWDKALAGATAGEPTLVKHPTDERDDFFLVPLNPADPSAKLGAWAMLDAKTLELREVSLLKDWKAPAFPDPDKDVQQLSNSEVTLADGTVKRFKPSEIASNHKNLVWAPSVAAVLPYWPVKEFTVPHPKTGKPEKVYLNQEGEIHTTLGPDNLPEKPATPSNPTKPLPKNGPGKLLKFSVASATLAGVLFAAHEFQKNRNPAQSTQPSRELSPPQTHSTNRSPVNISAENASNKPTSSKTEQITDSTPEPERDSVSSKDKDPQKGRIETLKDEIAALKKRGLGDAHPDLVKRIKELTQLTMIHDPPPKIDYDALQAEREQLSAILHHQEEGMDVKKFEKRLKQIEDLLKQFPRPGK